jgi:hypothetical protein
MGRLEEERRRHSVRGGEFGSVGIFVCWHLVFNFQIFLPHLQLASVSALRTKMCSIILRDSKLCELRFREVGLLCSNLLPVPHSGLLEDFEGTDDQIIGLVPVCTSLAKPDVSNFRFRRSLNDKTLNRKLVSVWAICPLIDNVPSLPIV